LTPALVLMSNALRNNQIPKDMEFNQIQELIRLVVKSKLSTFYLQEGDLKIIIRNHEQQQQQADNAAPPQVIYQAPQPVVAVPQTTAQVPPQPAPAPQPAAPAPMEDAPAAKPAAEQPATNLLEVKSPMVGTFYRSAAPDKPPFVKIGDEIEAGDTVCIIEAMKLFNEIESEVKGKIVKVLVEDATPVEYDQPLFLVEPA
jgi:acetyl-CoA carboxylase biotin carboxyl carrier protein